MKIQSQKTRPDPFDSGCAPVIKDADIDKVVVPQTPGNPGSPKTAAVKGAKGKNKVEPKELNEDLK
ncbi:hypothetical protein ABS858_23610 [Vibrio neptunius]|uniref:hypothetical protein n=1 Tax=Vibrio neptunius TaxID=170651 RepID=UPI003315A92A